MQDKFHYYGHSKSYLFITDTTTSLLNINSYYNQNMTYMGDGFSSQLYTPPNNISPICRYGDGGGKGYE